MIHKTQKAESTLVTTSLGSKQSMIVFAAVVIAIIVLFFFVKTYRALSSEEIVIETEEDFADAQDRVQGRLGGIGSITERILTFLGVS